MERNPDRALALYRAAEAGDNKHALEGIERITNIVLKMSRNGSDEEGLQL